MARLDADVRRISGADLAPAKALGPTVPTTPLARADEMIE
jgi:hypothetical protein